MRYFIITFGCQANRADSERIEARLRALGHTKAVDKTSANLIIINACSVRQSAIDRVYGKILAHGQSALGGKNKKIILTGCLLPKDKKKLKNKVDEIWHPNEYFDLAPVHSNPFSAGVPIMTGCNNFCAYCAVPHTRGREKSRPAKEIAKEAKKLVQKEYKEIWLLGQNVNSYKSDKIDFPKLLQKINDIPGKFWIRFASPHPKDFSDKLIKTAAQCEKVTKYINLPVQSGDNEVLKRMNRNYTREKYIKLVNKIRKEMPHIAISTDTIVGFPGETKKQFQNTLRLYKQIKFDMAFIAEYSSRPGTAAAETMKDNVSHKEKEKRKKILTTLLRKTAFENNKKLVGKNFNVLVDSEMKGRIFGRNTGNKLVEIINPHDIKTGKFIQAKIVRAEPWKLLAEAVKSKVVAVVGPTASGKSGLAVEIAQKFNGEIISADSRQVYQGMDIGTGKITKKEMKGIKHRLLDVAKPNKIFSAGDFKNLAEKDIEKISENGKLPIICGGTGFYIHWLLNSPETASVKPDWKLRKTLEEKPAEKLFQMLKKLDKERAKNIDSKNKRRLIRAIEIAGMLGKVPPMKPDFKTPTKSNFEILWLGIKIPPKELKKRIKKRLVKRLAAGMIKEVETLRNNKVSWKRLEDFGLEYRYIARYLQNKISKKEMVEQLNTAINQFAKRQMTWFKKYAPETHWITPQTNSRQRKNEAFGLVKKFLKN